MFGFLKKIDCSQDSLGSDNYLTILNEESSILCEGIRHFLIVIWFFLHISETIVIQLGVTGHIVFMKDVFAIVD